jgi:hypothetical protein
LTDISKKPIMEAVAISETSVKFQHTHGAISQKTVIFILAAVRPEISPLQTYPILKNKCV